MDMPAPSKVDELSPVLKAAVHFLMYKEGLWFPSGRKDHGDRWYPVDKYDCCKSVGSPSRAYPWPLYQHCKSAIHIANEYGISVKDLRELLKKKNLPLLLGINERIDAYVAEKLKGKKRKVTTLKPGVILSGAEEINWSS